MAAIDDLRRYVNEPTETTYTTPVLNERIAAASNLFTLASEIWAEKAAALAGLVDMQEGSSRRSLSQLQSQALKMAAYYEARGQETSPTSATRPSRTRPIERV